MYSTPYGAGPPAAMQNKALTSITEQEAYERATPMQRQHWWPHLPATGPQAVKAAPESPAAPAGGWDAVYEQGRQLLAAQGIGARVCRKCQMMAPHELRDGWCPDLHPDRRQERELKAIHARTILEQQAKLHQGASELVSVRSVGDFLERDHLARELLD